MKKIYFSTLFLMCAFMVNAQNWSVYDGSVPILSSPISFSTSNIDGDAPVEAVIEDLDITDNFLYSHLMATADSRIQYKHSFADASQNAFTMVMRVKGLSDTLNRVMEFDFDNATYRERLYILSDGSYLFDESDSAGTIEADVLDWNIIRLTKIGDSLNFYVNENPEPLHTVITPTGGRTKNYFRLYNGDRNNTLGSLLDWFILDETGAYAPGTGVAIPDSLFHGSGALDAKLSALSTSIGTLSPEFESNVLEYSIVVDPNTTTVGVTATANDGTADVTGTGDIAITSLPTDIDVTVTAESGNVKVYTIHVKTLSDDATLGVLSVSDGTSNITLDPVFASGTTSYAAVVPNGTATVTISARTTDGAASIAGDGAFTTLPGTATVTVTAQDGSEQEYSIVFTVEQGGDAVSENSENLFSFYPNPVNTKLVVNLTGLNNVVSVFNLLGETIQQVSTSSENIITIDMSAFESGIYIVQVENGEGSFAKRMIKE